MFYLSQPIAGLLLLTSQLFSGRVRESDSLSPVCPYKEFTMDTEANKYNITP